MFLKCLFYFFKFVGTAPMSINVLATKKNKAYHFLFVSSWQGILYNYILLCLSISTLYFIVNDTLTRSFLADKSHLELALDVGCGILVVITAIVILIQFSINQDKAVTIINKLNIIYRNQKIEFDRKNQFILLLRSVKIIVFTNVVPMILGSVAIGVGDLTNLFNFVPFLVDYMTVIHYTLILKLLCYFYRCINTELQSVLSFEVPIFISNNRFLDMDFQRMSNKIKQLREIHVLLSHLSKEVSDFYALPMFFCIAYKFLALIQYSYYSAAILSNTRRISAGYEVMLYCVSFTIIEIASLATLVTAAGNTVTESKRTGVIVGELIADCPNKLVLKQLNGFFSYLLQVQVHFTVFDLFHINESLLTSITSSITTYMVILLQFKETNFSSNFIDEHTEDIVSTPISVN